MLKAELQHLANATKLHLEGRLAGPWAESVMSLAGPCSSSSRLIVDLTEVSYVDDAGEEVLKWLAAIGAEFTAESCYSRDICERLLLPQGQTSRNSA
jgi:hypothetical protein